MSDFNTLMEHFPEKDVLDVAERNVKKNVLSRIRGNTRFFLLFSRKVLFSLALSCLIGLVAGIYCPQPYAYDGALYDRLSDDDALLSDDDSYLSVILYDTIMEKINEQ